MSSDKEKLLKRKRKIRAKVQGTSQRPRLSVYKSLKHIYAQIIDDEKRATLISASDLEIKDKKTRKVDLAYKVGELLAQKAKKKGIGLVAFDRGGRKYHGCIKALAEGARKAGLKF